MTALKRYGSFNFQEQNPEIQTLPYIHETAVRMPVSDAPLACTPTGSMSRCHMTHTIDLPIMEHCQCKPPGSNTTWHSAPKARWGGCQGSPATLSPISKASLWSPNVTVCLQTFQTHLGFTTGILWCQLSNTIPITAGVYHRYGKTCSILAMVITGVGAGCNFSTCDNTIPVTMVLWFYHRLSLF